jgi:hypothetical protein
MQLVAPNGIPNIERLGVILSQIDPAANAVGPSTPEDIAVYARCSSSVRDMQRSYDFWCDVTRKSSDKERIAQLQKTVVT